MSDFWKKCLVDLIVGLLCVVLLVIVLDVFHATTWHEALRLLSDVFFLPAALLLAMGGLTWTKNGGVFDGLGFTAKIFFERRSRNFEQKHTTFAEYREEREKKNSSPASSLVAGSIYLLIAVAFFVAFKLT